MNKTTLVLSHREIAALMPEYKFNAMVETVFREWGNGDIVMPAKVTLDMSRSGFDSWNNAMPAFIVKHNAAGMKWIGGYRSNPTQNMPYIRGIVILTEPENGDMLAVLNGGYISDWRTGASAAIAVKYLARKGFYNVVMVGAGTQGRTASVCIHQLCPAAAITAVDISAERRKALQADLARDYQLHIAVDDDLEHAVRQADVVVMLTTAQVPFIRGEWLKKGVLVLGMGSYQQSDDAAISGSDKIIVDCWQQAAHRGELKNLVDTGALSEKNIACELGDVVAGNKPGRASDDEKILAVLVGLGAHDVFIASEVYRAAQSKHIGTHIDLN